MMKPMAFFHRFVASGAVQETIARVEEPDRDKHRCRDYGRKRDVSGFPDEPRPDDSDGWSIERKQMPQREPTVLLRYPVGLTG